MDPSPISERRRALTAAFWLWPANCVLAWIIALPLLRGKVPGSVLGDFHFATAFLAHYALIHASVAGLLAGAAALLPRRWLVLWVFPPVLAMVHLFFHVDVIVHASSGEHFDLRAASQLFAPGISDSFRFSPAQFLKAAVFLTALAAALHLAARGLYRLAGRRPDRLARRLGRHVLAASSLLLAGLLLETGVYAYADLTSRADILVNSRVLAFYQPLTCKRLAARLGFKVEPEHRFDRALGLRYPLEPVPPPAVPRKLNVVWIAVEGWRHDALTPELAPNVWRFSQRCLRGERHYSTGNTTRYGIFGMFYGLNGFYWQPFLAARQGPLLIHLLQGMDYDIRAMGSANFRTPEFRLTCFADLPEEQILDSWPGLERPQDRDEALVARFREFLAGRDPSRPFFAFLFLDSSHSYRFKKLPGFKPPIDCRSEEFVSYEKLASDQEERLRAHDLYRNAIAYCDFLIGRALADLEERGLLENTVVMIAGDHGEEFGEAGHAGHNTAFHNWQVNTAFVLHYPGVKPGAIAKMTSHADWAPTTLRLLGLEAPPERYCQGFDILGDRERTYAVATGWSKAGIVEPEGRLVFPLVGYRLSTTEACDALGRPLADPEGFRRRMEPTLEEVLRSTRTFKAR